MQNVEELLQKRKVKNPNFKKQIIMARANDIKYLSTQRVDRNQKKYCRFKKMGIKYIDYKDPEFLKRFLNEQGKMLPRRITGTSLKYQRKLGHAVKKARQMALLPYVTDLLK